MLRDHAHAQGYELTIYYTNVEGDAINRIYEAADRGIDGVVMNPAGFTYAGYALKDCVKGIGPNMVRTSLTSVGSSADSAAPLLGLSPATDHYAETRDVEDPDVGYEADHFRYQQSPRGMRLTRCARLLRRFCGNFSIFSIA